MSGNNNNNNSNEHLRKRQQHQQQKQRQFQPNINNVAFSCQPTNDKISKILQQ